MYRQPKPGGSLRSDDPNSNRPEQPAQITEAGPRAACRTMLSGLVATEPSIELSAGAGRNLPIRGGLTGYPTIR